MPAEELLPSAYLTDGACLFAIVAVFGRRGRERLVTVENCLTLELIGMSLRELEHAGLELVRPAPTSPTLERQGPG
ncbi:MAG: hypothetical protein JST31_08675 [Actinobacteria bacterium]|nr:hypothetical protein [Actinomycetota bacterium]